MNDPSYIYREDLVQFKSYFLTKPHVARRFSKGETIWDVGEHIDSVYYLDAGVGQLSIVHEKGYRKILHFNGSGSVFPGCHRSRFKLDRSMVFTAFTTMDVLEFERDRFRSFLRENEALSEAMLEMYARWVNLLAYESAHQEYNGLMMRLCNMLYLLLKNQEQVGISSTRVDLTQADVAEMLAAGREAVANCFSILRNRGVVITGRGRIEVACPELLLAYCSVETAPDAPMRCALR
ncbi:Crp/Fnr family transcriptional regulator [Eggerthella sinensis]|uniref:Crp/Fnr family transcriptional regulator n=1 Tax=Eggerthella sinensis TaxID=242230 RepID=UPI00266C0A74|nr:Crp/Fnr family transcriptional regulator [Eggerthella sinensis]